MSDLFEKARDLQNSGLFEESIPVLEEYIRSVPGNASGHFRLGIACRRCGRPDAAVEQLGGPCSAVL